MKSTTASDVIIQKLRKITKSSKCIYLKPSHMTYIIDLCKKDVAPYVKSKGVIEFDLFTQNDLSKAIDSKVKPKWFTSQIEFNALVNETDKTKRNELFDRSFSLLRISLEKKLDKFKKLRDENNQFIKDKSQSIMYKVEFMVSGSIDVGNEKKELHFPLYFKDVSMTLNGKGRVSIVEGEKIIPNIPLMLYVANANNIHIEEELRVIQECCDSKEVIDLILTAYEKLGIVIDKTDANLRKSASKIIFAKENKSLRVDSETSLHEVRHAIVANYYEYDVEQISINNTDEELGYALLEKDGSVKNRIEILIAPYIEDYDNAGSYKDCAKINKNFSQPDFKEINSLLNDRGIKDIENYIRERVNSVKEILKNKEKTIELLIKYLIKHKFVERTEFLKQISESELIEEYYEDVNEIKFIKNTFNLHRVEFIGLFKELIEEKVVQDAIHILRNNNKDYIKELYKKFDDKGSFKEWLDAHFTDKDISWCFNADVFQQEAVFCATDKRKYTLIQGPPGTGKSQTILNIVADYLNNKKRILIVSEKITAISVINDKISRDGHFLKNLILDIYNYDLKEKDFIQTLNDKAIFNQKGFKPNSCLYDGPTAPNDFEKNRIIGISKKIEELDLNNNKHLLFNEEIFNNKQKEIINKIESDFDLQRIKSINNSSLDEFKRWSTLINEFEKFKKEYLNSKLRFDDIKKIFEKNNEERYNENNAHNFASLIITNKWSVSILKKSQFKKLANEMRLNELFGSQYNLINSLLKLDLFKYTNHQISLFHLYEEINEAEIDLNKLDNENKKNNFIEKYNDVKKDISVSCLLGRERSRKEYRYNSAKIVHKWILSNFVPNKNNTSLLKFLWNDLYGVSFLSKEKSFKIKHYWDKIINLFPVILATPENVSNYLPLEKDSFDLVIIDEASQMTVERAIPALYRAKKFIISGDRKQLRPESYITNKLTLENNKKAYGNYDELLSAESILDFCDALTRQNSIMLRLHYRSEHSSLIDYSNRNFYDENLYFIDHAETLSEHSKCFEVINVENGEWIKTKNKPEALRIISLLCERMKLYPYESLGVVVFSKEQANLIQREMRKSRIDGIDKVLESFDSLEPDSLFIKAINEVQGEERDVIIFGVTYGKDVTYYKLLTGLNTENRINVAITRAKKKNIIVKSHKAEEYNIPSTYNGRGPDLFFKYIKECEEYVKAKELTIEQNMNAVKEVNIDLYNYFKHKNVDVIKILNSCGTTFYISYDKEKKKYVSNYVVDETVLADPRRKLWFYSYISSVRGYIPNPISIIDIIDSNISIKTFKSNTKK